MRRGTEATWQSPSGPREAHVALTRRRRPRERAHGDAREGRHVAGRLVGGGPTSIVGTGYRGGAVTQLLLKRGPLFKRIISTYFLRVGLCPTRFLPVQDAWRLNGRRIPSGQRRSHGPESMRSEN